MTKRKMYVIKGIAIILICLHHLFKSDRLQTISYICWPIPKEIFLYIVVRLKWAVALFVFCTGYGLAIQIEEWKIVKLKEYIWYTVLRYLKVMQSYWFVYIVVLLSFIFTPSIEISEIYHRGGIFKCIASDFFILRWILRTPRLCDTWWYMKVAIQLVVAVPLIHCTMKHFKPFVTAGILGAILQIVEYNPRKDTIWVYLFALYFGCLCAEYKVFERVYKSCKKKIYEWLIMITGIVVFSFLVYVRYIYGRNSLIEGVIALFFCTMIVFAPKIPFIGKGLEYVGTHSHNIFLIHTIIKNYYFEEVIFGFSKNIWVMLSINLLVSLVFSMVLEYVKRYIGYSKIFETIEYKIKRILG